MQDIRLIGVALGLLVLAGCALSSGPVEGVVLDGRSGAPLPHAIVVARWTGTKVTAHTSDACYHLETAETDDQGRFRMPAWRRDWSVSDALTTSDGIQYDAYVPGYVRSPVLGHTGQVLLVPASSAKDAYFLNLIAIIKGCGYMDGSLRHLHRMLAPIAAEAGRLAETPQQQRQAVFLERQRDATLVDFRKPNRMSPDGKVANVDPRDQFAPEK